MICGSSEGSEVDWRELEETRKEQRVFDLMMVKEKGHDMGHAWYV